MNLPNLLLFAVVLVVVAASTILSIYKQVAVDFPWLARAWPYLALGGVFAVAIVVAAWSAYEHSRRAAGPDPQQPLPRVPFWIHVARDHWRDGLLGIVAALLVFVVNAAQQKQSEEEQAAADQRRTDEADLVEKEQNAEAEAKERHENAARFAESWGQLRSSIWQFAANCEPVQPKNKRSMLCQDVFNDIVDSFVRASWVLPYHVQDIRAGECATAATPPLTTHDEACQNLMNAELVARSMSAHRWFVYAYTVPGCGDDLKDALEELHTRTRELGCALLFSRAGSSPNRARPLHPASSMLLPISLWTCRSRVREAPS